MDLQNFIENFADQFDETDPSEITAVTEYRALEEWSSIMGMGIIAMVKEQYDKNLTGAELRSCKTVEDLYNLISSK